MAFLPYGENIDFVKKTAHKKMLEADLFLVLIGNSSVYLEGCLRILIFH